MPKPRPDSSELAARLVQALYTATGGRLGRFRALADTAERAGIAGADVDCALVTAERAGFVDRHGLDARMIGLTPRGLEAARAPTQKFGRP